MAPPVEEAPTKVVKVSTRVARRPSAVVEESAKGVATTTLTTTTTTTTSKEDDLDASLRNAVSSSYEARCVCVCGVGGCGSFSRGGQQWLPPAMGFFRISHQG